MTRSKRIWETLQTGFLAHVEDPLVEAGSRNGKEAANGRSETNMTTCPNFNEKDGTEWRINHNLSAAALYFLISPPINKN